MGSARSVFAGILGLALSAAAAAGDGLSAYPHADAEPWSRWQGRVALGLAAPAWRSGLEGFDSAGPKVAGGSLMGDYYFARRSDLAGAPGGFRVTSGVVFGPRAQWWLTPSGSAASAVSVERRSSGAASVWPARDTDPARAVAPYLGVGYTGLAPRSGWSFSADLGLLKAPPADLRLGARSGVEGGGDALTSDRRLAPVLQLGVSRSF